MQITVKTCKLTFSKINQMDMATHAQFNAYNKLGYVVIKEAKVAIIANNGEYYKYPLTYRKDKDGYIFRFDNRGGRVNVKTSTPDIWWETYTRNKETALENHIYV
jgi:hypothetical protein